MTAAEAVAQRLVAQGVKRVYGLCGGHIQPMWDAISRAGIQIVDVRHEAAAVYMAQAAADLSGDLGVALVTAGPGLTNAVTAISNAFVSRSPVLVLSGRPPRPQTGMGAMQDIPQAELVAPICRNVEKVSERHHVVPRMDKAIAAALGAINGATGPSYIDFATDLLDEIVSPGDLPTHGWRRREAASIAPSEEALASALAIIAESRRPLVISGRSAHQCAPQLRRFLEVSGALYLDSGESRGAIRDDVPNYVPALRGRAMRDADLVITLGRRLDFQLAYGSEAVFSPSTRFLRIGTCFEEIGETRRGDVEVLGTSRLVLDALLDRNAVPTEPDTAWLDEMRAANAARVQKSAARNAVTETGEDGRITPEHLVSVVNEFLSDDAVVVADGGDILSFARVGLRPVDYLDCGALGCLGIGVPFGVAAALERPGAPVVSVIGDGSFGFTAMEIDTAVRHAAKAVFVIANNEAWNIERHDQNDRYDGNLVGVDLPGCRYDQLAHSLGAHGERVEDAAGLESALRRALDNAPAVVDVLVSRTTKSPDYLSGLALVPPRHAVGTWNQAELARYTADRLPNPSA